MDLLAALEEIGVAADGPEDDPAAAEELRVERGEGVIEAVGGDVLGVASVGLDGPDGADGLGDVGVGIDVAQRAAGEVGRRPAGGVPVTADADALVAEGPLALVRAAGDAEVAMVAGVLAVVGSAEGVEREIPEAGGEDVGEGGAAVVLGECAIAAHVLAVAVGLEEIVVGLAVGQHAVDVDVDVGQVAVGFAVGERGGAVEIAGDLEVQVAAPVVVGELQILEPLREDREVGRQREILGGRAEEREAFRVGEAVLGHVDLVEQVGAGGVERGGAAVRVAGDRGGGGVAAGDGDRIVLVVEHDAWSGERLVNEVVRPAAVDADRVGVGGQGRQGARRGIGGSVPAGEPVVQERHRRLSRVFPVLALDAQLAVAPGLPRRGEEHRLALVEVLLAPAARVAPHTRGAHGEAFAKGLVHVEGPAVVFPGARGELKLPHRTPGLRALGGRRADAAERAVAEEDGVGAAAEIVPLQVVGIAVVELREKVPLRPSGTRAAHGVLDRVEEEILLSVVHRHRARGGPLGGRLQVGEVERVEKVAGHHRIRHGRVAQVGRQAAAGHRARRGETGVAVRAHFKRREAHGLLGRHRGGRARGGQGGGGGRDLGAGGGRGDREQAD